LANFDFSVNSSAITTELAIGLIKAVVAANVFILPNKIAQIKLIFS
jgi:hypothetical protein